jgi:hypothetical protein
MARRCQRAFLFFSLSAEDGGTTENLVPTSELSAVTAKQPTATAELTSVLGNTFHAHSCAAKTATMPTIGTPLRQSRKGTAQTIYT